MTNRNSSPLLLVITAVAIIVVIFRFAYRSSSPGKTAAPAETKEARLGPPDIYPDPLRTPGMTNPDIRQDNLRETLCNPRWSTKSVRPPAPYTNHLKVQQIREYGYSDTRVRDYEEDHFIPLELGGNPTDPRNLWPEPFETSVPDGGVRFKDKVGSYLHAQVCAGSLTLEQAQEEMTRDWYRVYKESVPH